MKLHIRAASAALTLILGLAPQFAHACACGCYVFDVGAGSLIPSGEHGSISLEYDFMDQTQNWSGDSRSPAAANDDKRIISDFIKLGGQYMINQDWTVMADLPVTDRTFRTVDDDLGDVGTFHDTALGDVRLMADYTGLSKDMSTGILFGVKLPTGDFSAAGFDRDTAIGSGSTDVLIGAYHLGSLTKDGIWTYFAQGVAQIPVAVAGGYRPGQEFDAASGVYYNGLSVGGDRFKIAPVLQVVVSARAPDVGILADRPNSGYQRVLLSPGVQVNTGQWRVYGDVELPVFQHVNGQQLTAPVLMKIAFSRSF